MGGIRAIVARSPILEAASGTGTIASGDTDVTITHGMANTPAAEDIRITGLELPTSHTMGAVFVDVVGATTFDVNVRNDPGASNWDFGWQVVILRP